MKSRGRWIAAAALLLLAVTAVWVAGGTARRPERSAPSSELPTLSPEQVQSSAVRVALSRQLRRARMVVWAHGSWCWFGDPRAVYVARGDETFVGWIGWRGQITVGEYNGLTRALSSEVIGRQAPDDHGDPSILVEPDGRLTVFWSGHSGPRMHYRTTVRPYDISQWGPLQEVRSQLTGPKGFTYPNPVILSAEHDKLYLFWRGADWSQDFATRTIDGRWSPARRLIAVPHERPYVKVASNATNTIALAFTNGHPRGVVTNIYYAAYRDGALWTASGRRIRSIDDGPISPSQADLVYDAAKTGVRSWVWDVALDSAGRPVIVYATFPSPNRHVYWYATWTGRRWVSHRMTVGGPTISPHTIEKQYSGGLVLDHADPSIVYLSRKVGRWFEIERWITSDGGYHWHYSTLVRTPGSDNVRPVVPRGAGGPIDVLWLHGQYNSYRDYRTSIAFLN
jgi:BNR repeat-containing family member